jgi:hypothetical protein
MERSPAYNSTYKKLAVQWLNEVLCFISPKKSLSSLSINRCLAVSLVVEKATIQRIDINQNKMLRFLFNILMLKMLIKNSNIFL